MTVVPNKVVVLSSEGSSSDHAALRLAQYLGADAMQLSLAGTSGLNVLRQVLPSCAAVIAHAGALVTLKKVMGGPVSEFCNLLESAPHLFIYGFTAAAEEDEILSELSQGAITGWSPESTSDDFKVASSRRCARQLAGLRVPGCKPSRDGIFRQSASQAKAGTLISAGDKPFLLRAKRGQSSVFFSAGNEIADLEEAVGWKEGLVPWFSRLVPLMMFLRSALGDRLWHNDSPRACFILDDPPLKSKYGFFEYARLLKALEGQKFAASIAFIPWNYRRSEKHIAAMFAAGVPVSLCVHGCDHTAAEFASSTPNLLRGKAKLALERMKQHALRSRVPFDEVMVFPQGLFSQPALAALDAAGYFAAVNTDLCAVDSNQWLTLRDLMEPAMTTQEGFPLFSRHYPRNLEQFALDLFVGKPALMVEHHTYFRQGYATIADFVGRVNALDDRLEWTNLANICCRTSLQRNTADGEVEVRFFTRQFELQNHDGRARQFVLSRKQVGKPGPVTVSGRTHFACEQEGDLLTIRMTLDSGHTVSISTAGGNSETNSRVYWSPGMLYRTKVAVRRWMCDIRDNYVETNRPLRALLSAMRRVRQPKPSALPVRAAISTASRQDAAA